MRDRKAACPEREMEQLATEELDRMLQSELRREEPDKKIVLPILKILRQREADHHAEVTEDVSAAWKEYQAKVSQSDRSIKGRKNSRISKAAAIAAVIAALILAFPFTVDADGTIDVLYRFTDSIIEFFSPGRKNVDTVGQYIFETDNPGLQQVYDAVVEMGITDPVVPMWLPEGYVLEELEALVIPGGKKLYAQFVCNDAFIVIQIKLFSDITTTQYEQENYIKLYEAGGRQYLIFKNTGSFGAAYHENPVECWISAEEEETLYEVINSIFWRDNK